MFTSRNGEQPRILDGNGAGPGAGAGMKIGAGHKPQAYDAHGRYTGPNVGAQGGAVSMRDGTIRMYAQDGEAEGSGGGEQGRETDDAPSPTGVLIAESGRVVTDAGGGLSGGNEVRGPVTPLPRSFPEPGDKTAAVVTWQNDQNKPDPVKADLKPQMQEAVRDMRTEVPKLDSFNVNSGQRKALAEHDPHADGRAVDINRINGVPVKDLEKTQTPEGKRAKEAAANIEEWAKNNESVNQFIGPNGGWNKMGRDWKPITDPELLNAHKNHYHINVFRN